MRLKAKKNHFTSGINVELYMIFNFEYIKNQIFRHKWFNEIMYFAFVNEQRFNLY